MTSRSGASSTPRNPLESLVISLVPSLAPPRDASSRTASRAGHRTDPLSPEAEKQRKDKVKALVEACEEILARCVVVSIGWLTLVKQHRRHWPARLYLKRPGGSSTNLRIGEKGAERHPEQAPARQAVGGKETKAAQRKHYGSAEHGASSNEG